MVESHQQNPASAIGLAKMFAERAEDLGRSKPHGDDRIMCLSEAQAKWLKDLLRREGLALSEQSRGFGLSRVETYLPMEDKSFRAELWVDTGPRTRKKPRPRAPRLVYRWKA